MTNKHDKAFLEVVTRLYIPVEDFQTFNLDDYLTQVGKVKVHKPRKEKTHAPQ
jgi:hypothetical protein